MTLEEHRLGGSTLDQRITYSHDHDGQLSGYEQRDGANTLISSASYQRDAQGRTANSSITYGKTDNSGTFSFQVGQSFNADGQLASHTYPDGSTQTYRYNAGQLASITLPNQSEIRYGNYQWMVPGQISTPGATKTLSYDALQRPTRIEVKTTPASGTAQVLMSRLYEYDAAGNITQIKSELGNTDYGYDRLSRLNSAQPDTALQTLGLPSEQYGYDAVHNRTRSAHQPGTWAYNQDNQLTQYPYLKPFTPGMQPIDTQVSYTPQGHTQKETSALGEKNYRYNAAERLIRYQNTPQGQSSPSLEAQYRYDPFGRRIAKSVKEANATRTLYFLYSEQGLMGEADETGKLTKAYGFNPIAAQQGLWSTDPIWQASVSNARLAHSDTRWHYLHTDHLGTPQLATAQDGSTSWQTVAEAFGAAGILQGQSSIEMNLRLPGQYFDSESGTHYNLQRDYRPNLGRYAESDPIGLEGGINTYGYVSGNPLSKVDPEGLMGNASGASQAKPGPGREPVDTSPCAYYQKRAQETRCRYYTTIAPFMCSYGGYVPLFWGVQTRELNCIRRCLVREDAKLTGNQCTDSSSCRSDLEIDAYHKACYSECGVSWSRYPGVNPLGTGPNNPFNPNRQK